MASNITSSKNKQNVYGRQIAFAAAFLLPASKLLETPSLLSKYAAGDLLIPALLHFILQFGVLSAVLFALSRSKYTLRERLESVFGKWINLVYIVYALYFLFSAILPLLDLEKFVYAAFFDTEPTTFSFGLFFLFCAFFCTKGIKAVGRVADICLFLFLLPFLALLIMSLMETDFSNLLPLFGTKFGKSVSAFTYTTPHFSDVVLLLPLLLDYRYEKGDFGKITLGYGAGAACILAFLAVFFGVYSSIAPREHYAFSKIAQYFPALYVIGRIDLLFVYLLSVVLLFYTALPLHYTTGLLARLKQTERKSIFAFLVNVAAFVFVLFCNRFYNLFYSLIGGTLPFVFWIFADLIPLLCLFLPKTLKNTSDNLDNSANNETDNKEIPYA